jgi:hypothetical protein
MNIHLLSLSGILLLIFITGCETTSNNMYDASVGLVERLEAGKQERARSAAALKQNLSQIELGMSLENFLNLFPDAVLREHRMDTYTDTKKTYERRLYSYYRRYFLFADGKLNNFNYVGN